MAMLAEKKIKQKWSQDPRNKTWSTDTNRFGYQMLTKMGWSDGKGLGASESGATSHVKISLKNDNLGVGAKVSHDDNWLAHQDDFNDLLAHLNNANDTGNSGEDQSAKNDIESIARNSKKRVFYERFIKSKNTSSYSATDMDCILGKRSKSAPDTPVDHSEDEDSDGSCASCPAVHKSNSLGLTTINSSQSVQEYFAMKMAELKKKRQQNQSNEEETRGNNGVENSCLAEKQDELGCDFETHAPKDKSKNKNKRKSEQNNKKKRKYRDKYSAESSSCSRENVEQQMNCENDKKKKKDRKRKLQDNEEVVENKKNRKKMKAELYKECSDSSEEMAKEGKISKKKKEKKKGKKVKKEQIKSDNTNKPEESEKRVSKKAKKYKIDAIVSDESTQIKDKKKQKKKKKESKNEKLCEVAVSNKDKKAKSKTTLDKIRKR